MRNKKLAAGIGGASAVTAVVAITAGTYALLSDEEERGAVATAGTMDLTVSNTGGDSFNEDGVFEVGPLLPGDSRSASFTLTNEGDVAGDLSFTLVQVANDENELTEPERDDGDDGKGKGELFQNLTITGLSLQNEKLTEVVDEPHSAGTLGAGKSRTFTVDLAVREKAGSVIQNDSAEFRIMADLQQQ